MRFLVVRSNEVGAAAHAESKLGDAVRRASELISAAERADTISIIDTRTLALFEERQICEFAERFHRSEPSRHGQGAG